MLRLPSDHSLWDTGSSMDLGWGVEIWLRDGTLENSGATCAQKENRFKPSFMFIWVALWVG